MVERLKPVVCETTSLSFDEVSARRFDIGVWFSGYEERAPWLLRSRFRPPDVAKWYRVEVEEDRSVHRAEENLRDDTGELLGGSPAKRNWDGHWRRLWRKTIGDTWLMYKRPLSVFVDISSMPRAIYTSLLVEAGRDSLDLLERLVFSYVPGEHRGPVAGHQQLDGLRTIGGLEGSSVHDTDPALILGLGYDGALAETVVDLFQLEHFSSLYAEPGISSQATEKCVQANELLLSRAELVETARVADLADWMRAIDRIARWYMSQRDIIILTLGPKPQVVAASLYCLANPAVGFRCLKTSQTTPIDVGVADGAEPYWMSIAFSSSVR